VKAVTSKPTTLRRASASGRVRAARETIARMQANDVPKKDVLVVARVAATTAVKKTWELIPYCHPIQVDSVEVTFDVGEDNVVIKATVEAIWKTGVEMEALTAVSAAALTIYDMAKAVEKTMRLTNIRLVHKSGGQSGDVWLEQT